MANFSRKIKWYKNTPAPDGSGDTVANWGAGTVIWADIEISQASKLFVQGQEYNGTYYTIQVNSLAFKYTPPLEQYKIEVDAFGVTRQLKILSAENPDLLSYVTILKCIEANG